MQVSAAIGSGDLVLEIRSDAWVLFGATGDLA
jgi:hypothetical protein